MASRSVELMLHILGDASGAEKATKAASTSVGKMQKTVGKLTIPALAVVGAIAAIGEQSVEAAASAEEAFHGLDAVFGRNAKTVEEWAKTSETSAGLSHAAYARLATSIGGQLHAMGLPMSQVLADTQALIEKGADLSAVYGGSTTDATMALAAAMRGASKASAKLGLSLKPATVNALLAARGQDKLKGAALNAAKAQATLDLIAQQSAGSVGKFAEEAGTAGESAKIAGAKWEDAKAALGKSLLPAVEEGTTLLGGMADVLQRNASLTSGFVGVIGALAVGILLLNGALKTYNAVTAAATAVNAAFRASTIATAIGVEAITIAEGLAALATGDLTAAMIAFDAVDPFTWIVLAVAAIVALVVAIVLAYKHSKRFQAIVTAAFNAVKIAAVAVARALVAAWSAVWGAITGGVSAVGGAFSAVWGAISGGARAVWSTVSSVFNAVRSVVVGVAAALATVFGPVFGVLMAAARLYFAVVQLGFVAIYTVARLAAQVILLAFEIVWAYLKLGASAAAALISAVFQAMSGPVRVVASAVAAAFRAGFAAIRSAAAAVAAFVRSVIAPLAGPARAVASAIASAFRTAFAAVSAAARTVASGIATAMSAVRTAFAAVGRVAASVGSAIRSGLGSITGFLDGITDAVKRLIGWLGKIKVPKIKLPGIGSVSAAAPSAATRRAPALALTSMAPRVGARSAGVSGASTVSGGLVVNVFGVLDGADAARKIRAILRDDDRRRVGVRVVARSVTG